MINMIDIGVNLADEMFKGHYNGKKAHEEDVEVVVARALQAGVERLIITGGSLKESREALSLALKRDCLFSTVGVHPTRCLEFEKDNSADEYMEELMKLIEEGKKVGKVVAVGEFGLDYDRTQFCPVEVQKKYFEYQMILAERSKLPLFLHMRSAASDFIEILSRNRSKFSAGVVHSFTGSASDLNLLLSLDLYIGINGCSLKTEENLSVMSQIPLNRLMIETDAPWCDIRPTHASYKYIKTHLNSQKKEKYKSDALVKGRNEPCNIRQVLEVIAGYRNLPVEQVAEQIYKNTSSVFFP